MCAVNYSSWEERQLELAKSEIRINQECWNWCFDNEQATKLKSLISVLSIQFGILTAGDLDFAGAAWRHLFLFFFSFFFF